MLDQKDLTHGARKYEPWSEELGNVYGVETASFLLPSERGGGKMDKARVDFFKKLKQKGINEIVATVNRDNNPSIKKQRELRDVCGGREYFRVVNEFSKSKNGKTLNSVRKCVKNRFIIKVAPEIFEKYLAKKLEKFKQYNIENRAIFEKDICR